MDQADFVARIDELQQQCRQRGIAPPKATRDVCEDVANLEAALGIEAGTPAGKPATAKATLDPVAYAARASEVYEGLPPDRRAEFLRKNEQGVRQMFLAADRHDRNPNLA